MCHLRCALEAILAHHITLDVKRQPVDCGARASHLSCRLVGHLVAHESGQRASAVKCAQQLLCMGLCAAASTGSWRCRVLRPLQACLEAAVASDSDDSHLWPRFKAASGASDNAAASDPALATALLDAVCQQGSAFWAAYALLLLPRPHELPLPICHTPEALEAMHGAELAQAVRQQQARLAMDLPLHAGPAATLLAQACASAAAAATGAAAGLPAGLAQLLQSAAQAETDSQPAGSFAAHPTEAEWALALLVSREFNLRPEDRAIVPLLDLVNHSERPNARCLRGEHVQGCQDPESFVLASARDIAAGEEVTISYTGAGLGGAGDAAGMLWKYGFQP